MKKAFLILFGIILYTGAGFSQTTYTAEIKGTTADMDASINKGTISFDVLNVKGQNEVDVLINKSAPYKKDMAVSFILEKSVAKGTAVINGGRQSMRWLFRFFLNAGINTVQFEGKTQTTQEFFKPWI